MFPKVLERNFDWRTELVPNKRKNVERERDIGYTNRMSTK